MLRVTFDAESAAGPRNALVGALLFALAGLPALAQQDQWELAMKNADTMSKKCENGAVEAAPQKSEASIVADKDKSLAKISVTREHEVAGGQLIGTVSTPVNTQDDATPFFTLDGPVEDIQLGLAWKKQFYDYNQSMLSQSQKSKMKLSPADNRWLFRAVPFHYLSFASSVGRTERKFFDLPGAERKEDRPSYSLNATYGRIFQNSRLTAGLTAQRNFKESAKARKCTVVGSSTLERCKDLPLGEAAMVDTVPLVIEYRIWGERLAFSPKLVYDFKQDVMAASLPIYFFKDLIGNLTGGIRLDWEDHQRPVASVFVSSPLPELKRQ